MHCAKARRRKRSLAWSIMSIVPLIASSAEGANPHQRNGITLAQGGGYAVCRSIVGALNRMPKNVGLFEWVTKLPTINGITQVRWPPSGDVVLKQVLIRGPFEQNGTVKTDIILRRTPKQPTTTPGVIADITGRLRRPVQGWTYELVDFSAITPRSLQTVGEGYGTFDVFIVSGQPWFVQYPSLVGRLQTAGILEDEAGGNRTSRYTGVKLAEVCQISFPSSEGSKQ